jgi:hypothetical protein
MGQAAASVVDWWKPPSLKGCELTVLYHLALRSSLANAELTVLYHLALRSSLANAELTVLYHLALRSSLANAELSFNPPRPSLALH